MCIIQHFILAPYAMNRTETLGWLYKVQPDFLWQLYNLRDSDTCVGVGSNDEIMMLLNTAPLDMCQFLEEIMDIYGTHLHGGQ